ncbi:hypothetical protein LCGC14_2593200 [marine sediment metagenome]|uniref:SCP domain-containing protein n=1 Tax=marine sediment metagenome TaxID=412755 RepID=A0A0F9CM52_9ZZZZ
MRTHYSNAASAVLSPAPAFEPLEQRVLLSAVSPSAQEQYLLELTNRARSDPPAEAARYGIALNEGVPASETITGSPKQPLAPNQFLTDSARKHSEWMLVNTFGHPGKDGSMPWDRMEAAGYVFIPPSGSSENLASYGTKPAVPDPTEATAMLHEILFVDTDYPDRGHRTNMVDPDLKELGTGIAAGVYDTFNTVMGTENFAYSAGDSFVTGVGYADTLVDDDFYTPSEGLAGLTVTATRQSDGAEFVTTTFSAGGYALALPSGTYDIVGTGPGLGGKVTYADVVMGTSNIKLDFTPDLRQLDTALVKSPHGDNKLLYERSFLSYLNHRFLLSSRCRGTLLVDMH